MTAVVGFLLAAAAASAAEAFALMLAIRRATRARHRAELPRPAPFAALRSAPAVAARVDAGADAPLEALTATIESALAATAVRETLVVLPPDADDLAATLTARFALHADGAALRSVTRPELALLRAAPADAERWTLDELRSDLLLPLRPGDRPRADALERAAHALVAAPDAAALTAMRTPRRAGLRGRLAAVRHARSVAAPQLAFGPGFARGSALRGAALLRRTPPTAPGAPLLLAETLVETAVETGNPGRPHAVPGRSAARLRALALVALALLVPLGGDPRSAALLGALLLVGGGLAAAAAADLALLLRPDLRRARDGWRLLAAAPLEAFGFGWLLGGSAPERGGSGTIGARNDP